MPLEARRIVSWISIHKLDYSGAEVARHLGVTNSCVTRFIASGNNPDIKGWYDFYARSARTLYILIARVFTAVVFKTEKYFLLASKK